MWRFLTTGELLADKLEGRRLKRLASMYSIRDNEIYKRGYLQAWLKCIVKAKAREMLSEVHEGIYGSHQGAKTLAKRIFSADLFKYIYKSF
jgi:hypothetical protein